MRWSLIACVALGCLGDSEKVKDATDTDDGDIVDPDRIDASCHGAPISPTTCDASSTQNIPSRGRDHIPWPTPIEYVDDPPSSGDHRPEWGRWGEYDFLPPQRWLHNLEHGGIALLYDPCLDPTLVAVLRDFVRSRPDDDTGPFRWALTPYPGLPAPVYAVAWEWTWHAECLDEGRLGELEAFVADHYRHGPEDFAADGSYETGWIGR